MTLRPSHQVGGLLAWIAICFAAVGLGGLVTTPNIPDWYAQLAKPAWTPPSWVFGPVWSCLYLMMALSAWLVWRQDGLAKAKLPIGLFVGQLGLNSVWSVLFFGLHSPGAAFVDKCYYGLRSWQPLQLSGTGRVGQAFCSSHTLPGSASQPY